MASVKQNITKKKVQKIVEVEVKTYNIELDESELQFLHTLLRSVGGSPKHSGRKFAEQIQDAINPFGVYSCKRDSSYDGVIQFRDNTAELFE